MDRIGYRAIVYAPRSVSSAETTPLTPAAGAPHADVFAVTSLAEHTASGITYRPYLDPPRGVRGSLDYREASVDSGEIALRLLDKRTPSGVNAQRWVTAYVGDDDGLLAWHGLLVRVWITLDGGATWSPWWTGRVTGGTLETANVLALTVADRTRDLEVDQFVGLPHHTITYAWQQSLTPVGRTRAYGNLSTVPKLRGPVTDGWLVHGDSRNRHASLYRQMYDLCDEAAQTGFGNAGVLLMKYSPQKCLVLANQVGSSTVRRFRLLQLAARKMGRDTDNLFRVRSFEVEELEAGEYGQGAMWSNGTQVEWEVVPQDGPKKGCPLYIERVHPVQLWKDMLDGKFGYLAADGSPMRTVAYDSAAFSALIADATLPTIRAAIEEPARLLDWLEENIFRPCRLSYRLDGEGKVVPIDLRLVHALTPAVSLTTADLARVPSPIEWETTDAEQIARVEGEYGLDVEIHTDEEKLAKAGDIASLPPSLLQLDTVPITFYDGSPGTSQVGDTPRSLKAPAFRGTVNTDRVSSGKEDAEGALRTAALALQLPLARGGIPFSSRHPRALVADVQVGLFGTVDFTRVPSPATLERGGARTVLCVSRAEDDGLVELGWLDLGSFAQDDAPEFDDPGLVVIDATTVDATLVGLTEGDRVEWQVAQVSSSVSSAANVPASAWQFRGISQIFSATHIKRFTVQSGARVFIRARFLPSGGGGGALPSAWGYPDPEYVDTDGLTAPSALAVESNIPGQIEVSWTNGHADLKVEVFLAVGSGVTLTTLHRVATLPAGSTRYTFSGLTPTVGYTLGTKHVDEAGGTSAFDQINATNTATGTIERPAGLAVVVPSAILLSLYPRDTARWMLLERAPDDGSGTAPDEGNTRTVANVPGSTAEYLDQQPIDGAVWWYRLRHVADATGANPSDPTVWVRAVAAAVPGGEDPAPTPAVLPAITLTPSQTDSVGTLLVTIVDPQTRLVDVAFATREGNSGADSGFVVDSAAPYTVDVGLVEGESSRVRVRVRYYGADGELVEDERAHTFASGAAALEELDPDPSGVYTRASVQVDAYGRVVDAVSGLEDGIPAGGTTGQVLLKASDDDFDAEWAGLPSGGGGGWQTETRAVAQPIGSYSEIAEINIDGPTTWRAGTVLVALHIVGIGYSATALYVIPMEHLLAGRDWEIANPLVWGRYDAPARGGRLEVRRLSGATNTLQLRAVQTGGFASFTAIAQIQVLASTSFTITALSGTGSSTASRQFGPLTPIRQTVRRALGTTVGSYVEIGSWSGIEGGIVLRISVTLPSNANKRTALTYIVAAASDTPTGWREVPSVAMSTPYSNRQTVLEADVTSGVLSLRLRHSAGSFSGDHIVVMEMLNLEHPSIDGAQLYTATPQFTPSTGTGTSGVTATTTPWDIGDRVPVRNVSSAYTASTGDRCIIADTTSAGFTIALPAPNTYHTQGQVIRIKNKGSNNLTLDPAGSALIDGATTKVLAPGASVVVICSGTDWQTW